MGNFRTAPKIKRLKLKCTINLIQRKIFSH